MFPKDGVAQAERIVASSTVLAGAIADAGIQDDTVAHAHVRDARAHGVDYPRAVGSEDPRWRDANARHPLHHPEVEVVECPRVNADAHIVVGHHVRYWQIVADPQLIEPAVRIDRQCSQRFPRRLYSATPSPPA